MFPVGYCPWCAKEIAVEAISAFYQDLTWTKCKTAFCRGNMEELITDPRGFVINPSDIAGRYLYSRPTKRGNVEPG